MAHRDRNSGCAALRPLAQVALLAFLCIFAASQGTAAKASETGKLASGEHDPVLGDVRLHYSVAGEGPLLIVCSPGWGASAVYLEGGFVPLEKNFKLLFLDTRGSGKSTRPADRKKMSGADMADDIERLRQYLGLRSIQLLGHSDSGSIVIDYAERYPASVKKLIVVDGITFGEGPANKTEDAHQEQIMKDLSGDPRYRLAIEHIKSESPPATDEQMAQMMQKDLALYFADPQKNAPVFAQTAQAMSPSAWALQAHAEANKAYAWRQEERLGEVRARTLIVVGKQDWICPAIISEHIHQGIPGSELVEIDDSGHFPWIEQPDRFFPAIDRFLREK